MKSPAFQVYVNDFLGSTKVGVMSTEEIGAYWLLLFLDWQEVGFVYDETALSRWCRMTPSRFRKAWVALAPCFTERDGRLYNLRLEKERTKQAIWRAKSAKGGRASGEARAKGGSPVVEPESNTPLPLPLPSPVTTSETFSADSLPIPPRSPKPKAGLVMTEAEREVLGYYGQRHPRRGPPDDEQIKRVRKGLRSYDVPQMKMAIDGNLEDPWAVKNGKHEIGWIFRNNDNINQAIEHYHRANAPLFDDTGKLTVDGQRVFGSSAA